MVLGVVDRFRVEHLHRAAKHEHEGGEGLLMFREGAIEIAVLLHHHPPVGDEEVVEGVGLVDV